MELREGQEFLLSPQGVDCHQLKIIFMPKWLIFGRPALGPYTTNSSHKSLSFLIYERKNIISTSQDFCEDSMN